MIKLRYGNTNTFLVQGSCGLLVDTDFAGTLPAFYKALKQNGIRLSNIGYVLATHFHPDHMGLIGDLMRRGVRLLLMDAQKDFVHFSDHIFERDRLPFTPIKESEAAVIPCRESRSFLSGIGVQGEIIHTPSHSSDSVSLILDGGDCFVGDLDPFDYIAGYDENTALKRDWERIHAFHPRTIYFAHRPALSLE